MDFCLICRSLGQHGVFLNIRMVKEAGEKGCLVCQVIISGIEKIEALQETHGLQAPSPKSHMVGKKHLEGCSLLVETKDEQSRRLYELEFYAEEGLLMFLMHMLCMLIENLRIHSSEVFWPQ
jgi:hypothetical protein